MSTVNKFLTTSQGGLSSLATEKTLTNIEAFLESGQLDVTLSGNSNVTIADVNHGGSQTNDLDVNVNSVGSSAIALGPTIQSNSIPVCLPTNLTTAGLGEKVKTDLQFIAANNVQIGSGATTSTGVQRVVLSNDFESTCDVKITDVDFGIGSQTNNLNVNLTSINNLGLVSTGAGIVNGGGSVTQRIVLSNDYVSTATVIANAGTNLNTSALALETGGNLDDINAQTANTNATASSINNILNARLPLTLGQKDSNNSLAAVLSNDYASTITNSTIFTQSCDYTMDSVLRSANRNLAQVVGGFEFANVSFSTSPSMVYIDKIHTRIVCSGLMDPDQWGDGTALSSGWSVYYKKTSGSTVRYITNNGNTIRRLSHVAGQFDTFQQHEWGAGSEIVDAHIKLTHPIAIDVSAGGTVGLFLGPDSYNSGSVSEWNVDVGYWFT